MTAPQDNTWTAWRVIGRVLICLFVLFGLAVLAFVICLALALNDFGSNK